MDLKHRKPFGEGVDTSEDEARLAGQLFHDMLDDLFTCTPETHESADAHILSRTLDIVIKIEGYSGIKARLYHQTSLNTGDYSEKVGIYESGENDEEWGPKICDYVMGSGDPVARRYDDDGESRKLAAEMPIDEEEVLEVIKGVFETLSLEESMGINALPVDQEEIRGLRELLKSGEPRQPEVFC